MRNLRYLIFAMPIIVMDVSVASTLEIYNDGAKYSYTPVNAFIGMSKGIVATCNAQSLTLRVSAKCPEGQRLCKELSLVEELRAKRLQISKESDILNKILSMTSPKDIDASKWIDNAEKLSHEMAKLEMDKKSVNDELSSASANFNKQATSSKALLATKKCEGMLKLDMPSGYIGAKLIYEADIANDKEISIKKYISLSNRSGIDIVAKDAFIYAKSSKKYLSTKSFSPWVASISRPMRYSKKSRAVKSMKRDSFDMVQSMAVNPVPRAGKSVQTGYKDYHISALELPSTGESIKIKIEDYKTPMHCENTSYSYTDSRVYNICTISPVSPIESNKWIVKKGKELISKAAFGKYTDGKYALTVDIDDEIRVDRKPMIKRDRSSGIFGGSIRKKDGYTLDITNISDKTKSLKLIERIPSSTTDKIESKLISIKGDTSHKIRKNGQLDISVTLKPNEHKQIEVIFELRYDKDTRVRY